MDPYQSVPFVGSQQTGEYSFVSKVPISASVNSKSNTSRLGATREAVAVLGSGTWPYIRDVRAGVYR